LLPVSSVPVHRDVWTLRDLIDFEVLVREDSEAERRDPQALADREQAIRKQLAVIPARHSPRRATFREWLELRRRERFQDNPSPGEEVVSVLRWLRGGLIIAGALVARGAVWSFFRGAETATVHPEPVNVLWYALVCIGLPFLFSLYGFWVLLGYKALPKLPTGPAFLRGALFSLAQPLVRRAAAQISESLGAERRLHAQSLLGALRQRLESRRSALGAMFFHLLQAFGVSFTIGVLVFSWIDCTFYNRSFGWQTTNASTTADRVHSLARGVAKPWSWVQPEGVGFPTLEEVDRTNFVRFHSPADFPKEAAYTWAAFLIWAALVYGVLPRLVLERLTAHHVRAALRREDFTELRFDPLWERLTPREEGATIAAPAPDAPVQIPERPKPGSAEPLEPRTPDAPGTMYRLVLPGDIREPGTAEAVAEWMRAKKGWEQRQVVPLGHSIEDREAFIGSLRQNAGPHLLLLQESFMPPVEEYLQLLREIRVALGSKTKVLVGLIGKPNCTPLAAPPREVDAQVWEGIVAKLGDPNLGVFSFLPAR
jgi:hypothetical protein